MRVTPGGPAYILAKPTAPLEQLSQIEPWTQRLGKGISEIYQDWGGWKILMALELSSLAGIPAQAEERTEWVGECCLVAAGVGGGLVSRLCLGGAFRSPGRTPGPQTG